MQSSVPATSIRASFPLLRRLMPACFRVQMIRGLPNERGPEPSTPPPNQRHPHGHHKPLRQWLPQQCEVRISPSYVSMSSSSDAVVTSHVLVRWRRRRRRRRLLAFVVGGDGRGSWRSTLEGGGAETFSLMSASGNADGAWNVKMLL